MTTYSYGGKNYKSRDAAKAAAAADKAKTGAKTTPTTGGSLGGKNTGGSGGSGAANASRAAQLESMKQSLLKMSADLKAGKVTGLDPSPSKTGGGSPTAPNANTINAGYAAALKAAQPISSTATASPTSTGSTYTVKSGDTLSQIAARNGMTLNALIASNPQYQQNPNLIRPGETIRLNTTGTIPSTAITNPSTPSDAEALRQQLAQIEQGALDIQNTFNEIYGFTEKPFVENNKVTNYEKIISDYVTGRQEPTDTQRNYDRTMNKMTSFADSYWKNREGNINKAYDEFGVEEKNDNLARVQKDMAEREIKMREDLRKMETAPEYRGVSREFAVDYATSVREEAAFELANLAILESAYRGDAERAERLAQNLIDSQYDQYKGQIEVYQMKLKAMEPQLNNEQKQQALKLELALDQMQQVTADKKEDAKLKQQYAILAAEAGANPDVYKTILASKSADEAFLLAAPYMKATPKGTTSSSSSTVGGTSMVTGVSPWTSDLTGMDFMKAKTADIKAAVNQQFSPQFSSYLITVLNEEQLKDFLTKYEATMRNPVMMGAPEGTGPMNIDPQKYLEYYFANYLRKELPGTTSSGTSSTLDRINGLFSDNPNQ
jgi:LysM repeat protein